MQVVATETISGLAKHHPNFAGPEILFQKIRTLKSVLVISVLAILIPTVGVKISNKDNYPYNFH